MEQYEKALADLDRAISLEANYAWALAGRGATYRQMEQYEKAKGTQKEPPPDLKPFSN